MSGLLIIAPILAFNNNKQLKLIITSPQCTAISNISSIEYTKFSLQMNLDFEVEEAGLTSIY